MRHNASWIIATHSDSFEKSVSLWCPSPCHTYVAIKRLQMHELLKKIIHVRMLIKYGVRIVAVATLGYRLSLVVLEAPVRATPGNRLVRPSIESRTPIRYNHKRNGLP